MTNSSRCGAGARSGFEPAPRRSVFRRRSSTCSGPRPPRGRRGGTSGVRCRAQAHRKLPGTPHPGHRLRPAKRKGNVTRTRTKGSARGRGNRTGNAKTDQSGNRIPTIGKEFNPAKARRIARIPRFSVATDKRRAKAFFHACSTSHTAKARAHSDVEPLSSGTIIKTVAYASLPCMASFMKRIESSPQPLLARVSGRLLEQPQYQPFPDQGRLPPSLDFDCEPEGAEKAAPAMDPN